MRQARLLAAAMVLCAAAASAHAEHFQFRVDLTGTYSDGGAEGCFPPFDQPACPREGSRTAIFSFDTPGSADGSWLIAGTSGDITDFTIDLGWLTPGSLYGGVNTNGGIPNGTVQTFDGLETFTFDWAARTASWVYDYQDHNPYGSFVGTLSAVPESPPGATFLVGLAVLAFAGRRRGNQSRPHAAKSGFSNPGLA